MEQMAKELFEELNPAEQEELWGGYTIGNSKNSVIYYNPTEQVLVTPASGTAKAVLASTPAPVNTGFPFNFYVPSAVKGLNQAFT